MSASCHAIASCCAALVPDWGCPHDGGYQDQHRCCIGDDATGVTNDGTPRQERRRNECSSEAAPCPLQPCYFDKWDIFADTWDCQYAMGLPVCIFNNIYFRYFLFLVIFSCPIETVPYLRNFSFQKFGFPSIFIFLYFHLI